MGTHHVGERPYSCPLCTASFTRSESLKSHIDGHEKGRLEVEVRSQETLYNNELNNNLNNKLVCDQGSCAREVKVGAEDTHKPNQLNNKFVPEGGKEKPYECKLCPYASNQSGNLRTHMLTHTKVKNFECDFCQKTFARKGELKLHRMNHT